MSHKCNELELKNMMQPICDEYCFKPKRIYLFKLVAFNFSKLQRLNQWYVKTYFVKKAKKIIIYKIVFLGSFN